jgi:hypothetical protein
VVLQDEALRRLPTRARQGARHRAVGARLVRSDKATGTCVLARWAICAT